MMKAIALACVSVVGLFADAALAQNAVQWRVEDGGNGHWYGGVVVSPAGASWTQARSHANEIGGDLAIVRTTDAAAWVFQYAVNHPSLWSGAAGPWLGAWQEFGSAEPAAGWRWVDGDPVSPLVWSAGQPDDATVCGGNNNRMAYWNAGQGSPQPYIEDSPDSSVLQCGGTQIGLRISAVVEWSADCNADGIVDYGQIRAGQLADANANNIPDCCEQSTSCTPCPGDITGGGEVNGVDLAAVLGAWGTDGQGKLDCDVNSDGIVNGADLAVVLSGWGPCP